jgi:hypothetical protein
VRSPPPRRSAPWCILAEFHLSPPNTSRPPAVRSPTQPRHFKFRGRTIVVLVTQVGINNLLVNLSFPKLSIVNEYAQVRFFAGFVVASSGLN